jgi:acyl carrier protein
MSEKDENNKLSEEKKQAILLKVKPILARLIKIDEEKITLPARLIEDLGIDSLDTVELIMAFEEEFSIEVSDDAAEKARTVEDIIVYLAGKIKE